MSRTWPGDVQAASSTNGGSRRASRACCDPRARRPIRVAPRPTQSNTLDLHHPEGLGPPALRLRTARPLDPSPTRQSGRHFDDSVATAQAVPKWCRRAMASASLARRVLPTPAAPANSPPQTLPTGPGGVATSRSSASRPTSGHSVHGRTSGHIGEHPIGGVSRASRRAGPWSTPVTSRGNQPA